jgi:isopenicillin-N N-acyltransferase-like protein
MHGGPLRVLEIHGDPTDFGRSHGLEYAEMIRAYLADRLGLSGDPAWAGHSVRPDIIMDLAEQTLPYHRAYSPGLYEELEALAAAAGVSVAEAVVVGGFTDLVDIVRALIGTAPVEDDCTAVIDPVDGVFAQTWDMHASAGEYVVMLKLDPIRGPAAVVQTTAGCLGQIGMNEASIGVGINNLTAIGRPGVTWNFVVRKVLEQTDFDQAVGCVLDAELAGGHNYMLIGPDGSGVNIEAMPSSVRVTPVSDQTFVHTNHCLDLETMAEEGSRSYEHQENSVVRLEAAMRSANDLVGFFADPAIARRAASPRETATCGAVVMRPASRRLESVWGVPGDEPWETFQL